MADTAAQLHDAGDTTAVAVKENIEEGSAAHPEHD